MSFSIQTNTSATNAQENLRVNQQFQSRTIARLTSGYRINTSADDAAGLAVANKFRNDTAELTQGVRNANDGVSQLQIIDGGMSNISKMLDRLSTLATQSASSAFTGSRATLNNEYSQLLNEIDRQASNIGLNTNGANNKNLSVYIGGATNGSAQTNATVSVDLSGGASAVDQLGLGLSGSSVAGAAIKVGASTGLVNTGTVTATMNFIINTIDSNGVAQTKSLTTLGGAGVTAANVVDDLNKKLAQDTKTANAQITFAIGNDGTLMVGGNSAFTLESTGAAGALLVGADDRAAATPLANKAMANLTSIALVTATGAASTTFTNSAGESRTVSFTNEGIAAEVTALNLSLKDIGIQAVYNSTSNIVSLQSNNTFTFSSTTAANNGIAAALSGKTVTGADNSLVATASATAAISRIQSAISLLGSTQGKIGSGQNKLQYAINLAQSQISNFSAAESQIRDADVAAEAANLTKAQVLQQASIAAMAQANSAPQAVLALLR